MRALLAVVLVHAFVRRNLRTRRLALDVLGEHFDGTTGLQQVAINDKTRFMSTILLFNGYYDIRTGTAFTPYIGGGLGFTVNQLDRSNSSVDTAVGDISVSARSTKVQFAGAAMAGLTYDINSFISLDVGYRYLFIGGSDVSLLINGVESNVSVGGIGEQQVRAGFRFYVN